MKSKSDRQKEKKRRKNIKKENRERMLPYELFNRVRRFLKNCDFLEI